MPDEERWDWRRYIEDELKRVRDTIRDYPALRQQVGDIAEDNKDLKDEMKSLRRALYTAAVSIAGGAILFALTIFQVLGD